MEVYLRLSFSCILFVQPKRKAMLCRSCCSWQAFRLCLARVRKQDLMTSLSWPSALVASLRMSAGNCNCRHHKEGCVICVKLMLLQQVSNIQLAPCQPDASPQAELHCCHLVGDSCRTHIKIFISCLASVPCNTALIRPKTFLL